LTKKQLLVIIGVWPVYWRLVADFFVFVLGAFLGVLWSMDFGAGQEFPINRVAGVRGKHWGFNTNSNFSKVLTYVQCVMRFQA